MWTQFILANQVVRDYSDFQHDWKIVMTTIQFNLSAKFPKFCIKSPFWPSKDYFWQAHRNGTFLCSWQGWTPRPAGNPPRGEGGVPRPAPPRKNDQNRGEVAGQNKGPNFNFSNRGDKLWNNITTLNNAQSSLSIGYARESKK